MKRPPTLCWASFKVLREVLVVLFGRAPWVRLNRPNVKDGGAVSRLSYFILLSVVLLAVQTSPRSFRAGGYRPCDTHAVIMVMVRAHIELWCCSWWRAFVDGWTSQRFDVSSLVRVRMVLVRITMVAYSPLACSLVWLLLSCKSFFGRLFLLTSPLVAL
jgi:hypothetical protein